MMNISDEIKSKCLEHRIKMNMSYDFLLGAYVLCLDKEILGCWKYCVCSSVLEFTDDMVLNFLCRAIREFNWKVAR